jgi:hypothetical protein
MNFQCGYKQSQSYYQKKNKKTMEHNFDEKDTLMLHIWNPAWATVQFGVLGWLQVVGNNCLWAGDMDEVRLVCQVVDGLREFPQMNGSRQMRTVGEGIAWWRWYERQCEHQKQLDFGEGVSDTNDIEVQGCIRDLDAEYMAE